VTSTISARTDLFVDGERTPGGGAPLAAVHPATGAVLAEAGFPAATVRVLPGTGQVVGEALAVHPDVVKVIFTGSTTMEPLVNAAQRDRVLAMFAPAGRRAPPSSPAVPPRRPRLLRPPGASRPAVWAVSSTPRASSPTPRPRQ
jgi:hypothetical protein